MVEEYKLRHKHEDFEEDEASIDSRERNKQLKQDFEELYIHNCERSGKKLTCVQNTTIFVSGNITRLLLPPRTHYADCLKRISENIYVQIKK